MYNCIASRNTKEIQLYLKGAYVMASKEATSMKSFRLSPIVIDTLQKASFVKNINQADLISQQIMRPSVILTAGFFSTNNEIGTPACVAEIVEMYQQRVGGEMTPGKSDALLDYLITNVLPAITIDEEKIESMNDYLMSNMSVLYRMPSREGFLSTKLHHFTGASTRQLALYALSHLMDDELYKDPYLFRIFVVVLRDCAEWAPDYQSLMLYPAAKPIIEKLFENN